jgi:hypothetical protein
MAKKNGDVSCSGCLVVLLLIAFIPCCDLLTTTPEHRAERTRRWNANIERARAAREKEEDRKLAKERKRIAELQRAADVVNREIERRDAKQSIWNSQKTHWLNRLGNETRHNPSCQHFHNTNSGRYCGPNEGTPCSQCGG